MARLITVSGNHLELASNSFYVFGRDSRCDVAVEDCSCSRRHAKIELSATGDAFIEDLKSRNGTFLNGHRVLDLTLIPDGGQIRLGSQTGGAAVRPRASRNECRAGTSATHP